MARGSLGAMTCSCDGAECIERQGMTGLSHKQRTVMALAGSAHGLGFACAAGTHVVMLRQLSVESGLRQAASVAITVTPASTFTVHRDCTFCMSPCAAVCTTFCIDIACSVAAVALGLQLSHWARCHVLLSLSHPQGL